LGLGTLLRIKPRARRSFLTKERPSGDASGSLSQPTRIVYALGYGAIILLNATLIFDVELLDVKG
jgi:hypothetical protein